MTGAFVLADEKRILMAVRGRETYLSLIFYAECKGQGKEKSGNL